MKGIRGKRLTCRSQLHDSAGAYNQGCRCPKAIDEKQDQRLASDERRRNGTIVRRNPGPIRDNIVRQLIAGLQPIGATQSEKTQAIEYLLGKGSGATAVATIIGTVTLRTVQRHAARLRDEAKEK